MEINCALINEVDWGSDFQVVQLSRFHGFHKHFIIPAFAFESKQELH